MNYNSLQIFVTLYETKSIAEGARLLNTGRAHISNKISDLEAQLGIKLFDRIPAGVNPTPQAKILYQKAYPIYKACDHFINNIEDALSENLDEITITTTRAIAAQWLMQALPEFVKHNRNVNLKVIGDDNAANFQHYNCDVAIQPYLDNNPNCIQNFLLKCHVGLYASQEYLDEFGSPTTVEDLLDHKIIGYTETSNVLSPYDNVNWHLSLLSHKERISPYLTVNSSDGLQRAAMANLGIISMSQEAIAFNHLPLKRVLPDVNGPIIDLYFSIPKSLEDDQTVHSLYDTLKAFLTKEVSLINKQQNH